MSDDIDIQFGPNVGNSHHQNLYTSLQELLDMISETPVKPGSMIDQVRKFFIDNIDLLVVQGCLRRWYKLKYDTYDGYDSDPSSRYTVSKKYWQDYIIPLGLAIEMFTPRTSPFKDPIRKMDFEFPDSGPACTVGSIRDYLKERTYRYKTKKVDYHIDDMYDRMYQTRYDTFVATLTKFLDGLKPLYETVSKLKYSKFNDMLQHTYHMVDSALYLVQERRLLSYHPVRAAVKRDNTYEMIDIGDDH